METDSVRRECKSVAHVRCNESISGDDITADGYEAIQDKIVLHKREGERGGRGVPKWGDVECVARLELKQKKKQLTKKNSESFCERGDGFQQGIYKRGNDG